MTTSKLEQAYEPEIFRQQAYQMVDMLVDYMKACKNKDDLSVINWHEPEAHLSYWREDLKKQGQENDFFGRVLDRSVHILHPRYLGHQMGPPVPIATLGSLLCDWLNNGMGVYEVGQVSTSMDKIIIDHVIQAAEMGDLADGILTSGGSIGNLTAMLAARQAKAGYDSWETGHKDDIQLGVMVSEQAHYCVERAAKIMGWGEAGVIKVPVNENFQMDIHQLEDIYEQSLSRGIQIIAIAGSACTTSTGSYDDLNSIADFCESKNLWFHVDGAHGGAAIFSQKYRHLLKGLNRADSFVMDFHKMLLSPALVTALIFKNGERSYETFAQHAAYLFGETQREWYNMAKRTLECTKNMMSLKVYSIIRTYGIEIFDEYVSRMYDLGKVFCKMVQNNPYIEVATEAEANIICFRYLDRQLSTEELNQLNEVIRLKICQTGLFYIVQTKIQTKLYIRVCLMNPFTREEELDLLIEKVVQEGKRQLSLGQSVR